MPGATSPSRWRLPSTPPKALSAGTACTASRTRSAWALAQPHRYLLLFGTPLPGFHAPQDTIALAHRTMSAFLSVLDQPVLDQPEPSPTADPVLDGQLAAWARSRGEDDHDPTALLTGLRAFTRLHGVLSLEVAGQFGPMGFDPALLYRAEVESLSG